MSRRGKITVQAGETFYQLLEIAKGSNNVYVGSTDNPNRRAEEHDREYSGVMYTFRTENMRKDEDKLLQETPGKYNEQRKSNAENKPGFVYVIIGRKI